MGKGSLTQAHFVANEHSAATLQRKLDTSSLEGHQVLCQLLGQLFVQL